MKGRRTSSGAAAAIAALMVIATAAPLRAYTRPGHTERVSTPHGGRDRQAATPFAPLSHFPSVSADGRFVAFQSSADDLVRDDVNKTTDIFVHDRKTRRIQIVSIRSDGTRSVGVPGPGGFIPGAGNVSISATGRYVAFSSAAVNVVDGDTNAQTDVFAHDRRSGRTERVSVASNGRQANAGSSWASISLDGRFVAFESLATNLVPRDTNGHTDIFVHDRKTDRTERVSVSSGEAQATDASHCGSLGASGRYVVFTSYATNLTPTPGGIQVYIRDRKRGITELISVPLDGPEPAPALQQGSESCPAGGRALSANGRYVVFESYMPDLVPNDANGITPQISNEDVFLRDRATNETRRISVTSAGEEVDSGSSNAAITPDGRHVAFISYAGNLSSDQPAGPPGPLSADSDVFIHDVPWGITHWISKGLEGAAARSDNGFTTSVFPAPSVGGRVVGFHSSADNLVKTSNVASSMGEIFVRDRGWEQGVAELVATSGPSVDDGRLARDDMLSIQLVNLEPARPVVGLPIVNAEVIHRRTNDDLFARLGLQDAPAGAPFLSGTAGRVYGLSFSVRERTYEVRAALGPEGGSGAQFGLFSCGAAGICTDEARLAGGFGTTGSEIVVAIPLQRLGVSDPSELSGIVAFSAPGSYRTGRVHELP